MCSWGRPVPGVARANSRFWSADRSPKMYAASTIGHREDRRLEEAAAASRPRAGARASRTSRPRARAGRAAAPVDPSGASIAADEQRDGRAAPARGRAPRAAQPSASAQPGGTRTSAIHASTSALADHSAMTATLTKIDSGATSAHPRPRSRASTAGQSRGGKRDAERLGRVERGVVELEPQAGAQRGSTPRPGRGAPPRPPSSPDVGQGALVARDSEPSALTCDQPAPRNSRILVVRMPASSPGL